jgi:hypothetical protein
MSLRKPSSDVPSMANKFMLNPDIGTRLWRSQDECEILNTDIHVWASRHKLDEMEGEFAYSILSVRHFQLADRPH